MRVGYHTILSLLVVFLVAGCSQPGGSLGKRDPVPTLDSLEIKTDWLDYRIGQERWEKMITGQSDSLEIFEHLYRAVISDEAVFASLQGSRPRFHDEIDKRRYDILYADVLRAAIDNSPIVEPVYDSLVDYFATDWCTLDGVSQSVEKVKETMRRGERSIDRETAFRALAQPAPDVIQQFGRLVRLRNQAARRMGYSDYFSLVAHLAEETPEAYDALIDRIDSVTRPKYEEVLQELRRRNNDGVVEIWDWESGFASICREVDSRLPVDSQLAFVKRSLFALGFDLDSLSVYFHFGEVGGIPVETQTLIVRAPYDVRVVVNLSDGLAGTVALMRAIATAVQVCESAQDSQLLSGAREPVWRESIAELFERFCYEPQWLVRYAGLPESEMVRFEAAVRARQLLNIRLLLAQAAFEREVYRNPNADFGGLYWDLFARYTMLPRHDDLAWWAADEAFVTAPLSRQDLLSAHMAAAQTIVYLRDNYGHIIDNPEVRSFLVHNYFRFGSRYPWRDLVERATGKPVSAAALGLL